MFKRIMLTLTFAAAFSAAGLYMADNADARWGRSYSSYYYGPRANYYGYGYRAPYRTYYNGYYGNGYYAPRYYSNYGNPGYYYYRPVPRVAVQVGPVWR